MEKSTELGKKALAALILIAASPAALQCADAHTSAQFNYAAQFACSQTYGGMDRDDDDDDDHLDDLSDNYQTSPNSNQPSSNSNQRRNATPSKQTTQGNRHGGVQNPSSYQGTTTGPGINGGYPATPSGVYNVESER